jgi:hypothetical protein
MGDISGSSTSTGSFGMLQVRSGSTPGGTITTTEDGKVGISDSAPEYQFNVKYHQKTEGTTTGPGLIRVTAHNSATTTTNWGIEASYNDTLKMISDNNNPAFGYNWSGIAYADITWNDNAFDYAEFFQWKTPLASNDAVEALWGLSVVLDGDTVRIAEAGEEDIILGVVRPKGSTAYHGDALHWQGKYLKDVWGNFLQENYTKVMWTDEKTERIHSYHHDEIPEYKLKIGITRDTPNHYLKEENFELDKNNQKIPLVVPSTAEEKEARNYTELNHEDNDPSKLLERRKFNPSYDESVTYNKREDRPREWVVIGLLGQVPVRDTAVIPDHWKKMKNLESGIDKYYIK